MFKLLKLGGSTSIIRLSDGFIIPLDLANMDYQEVLAWVALGNTIAPADPPTPAEVASNNYKGVIRRRAANLTPIEAVLLLKTIGE